MKLCTIIFGVLAMCGLSYALEHGPLLTALQPQWYNGPEQQFQPTAVLVEPTQNRHKRSLLLGAGAAGAAGLVGAGLLGAGVLGVGLVGAKAGLVGGALAATALSGRSFGGGGGWGHGGGYYSGGGYSSGGYYGGGGYSGGGYSGGHGGYYRSYPTYVVEEDGGWC